jgi:DNA-binding CsgD family transcriptional regulator
MSQHESRLPDSPFSSWTDCAPPLDDAEIAELAAARGHAMGEAAVAITRELNGPLTALLLYLGEIKLHSHSFAQAAEDRAYLQKIIDNALQQTKHVCVLVEQLAVSPSRSAEASNCWDRARDGICTPQVARASAVGQKPLTRREREVLNLISEGHTNKQGALRMCISPRTFESHRAEVMRKLGARNTADLVRAALLYPEA